MDENVAEQTNTAHVDDAGVLQAEPFSVTTRVLLIPEVFNNIMQFSERDASAICTRVCRAWKDVAKGWTWKTMSILFPLLNLLAPLESRSGESNVLVCRFYLQNPARSTHQRSFSPTGSLTTIG